MLLDKGSSVLCEMVDGSDRRLSGGMLHDPSGKHWPKKSVLIASYRKGNREATDAEMRGAPDDYLGKSYVGRIGEVTLPPKALSKWQRVGDVDRIYYTRRGHKRPGRYQHKFNKMSLTVLFKGKGKAVLYRCGRAYRLELPRGAIVDSRGFVYP